MRKEDARLIIEKFGLLPRPVSKQILRDICCGSLPDWACLGAEHRERLSEIAHEYRLKAAGLGSDVRPKNLPFFLLLKDRYPEFDLREVGGQVQMESYFRGVKPSILSLLLGLVPREHLAPSAYESHLRARGVDARSHALRKSVFQRAGVVRLSEAYEMRLAAWLEKGRKGEALTIVSPVCPDYAAEPNGDGKYRFTFENLNAGVGLAAQRLFESMPALRDLFEELTAGACPLTHHIYIGDFEGFSEENQQRVRLGKSHFLSKLLESCEAISAQAPRPVVTGLFTDLCGGEEGWRREYQQMQQRVASGEFAAVLDNAAIREIALARRPLYQRWFPARAITDGFFERLVVQQGIEYAVMGKLIRQHWQNPLVLGADHHKMGCLFYTLAADIPVLYLSRNYE